MPWAFLLLILSQNPSPAGHVTGVVKFTGPVPPAQRIETTDGTTLWHRDLVVHAESKGLRHVFVTLEDAPARPKAAKAAPVLVDQKDMVFLPRVVAVQHGQAVRFGNSDTCNHSVMANSILPANQFNRFVGANDPFDHTFDLQKNPILIGCSLHAWMKAYVYTSPHPWFAVTDERGRFRLADVPPGKYTCRFHHADTGHQERRAVEVQPGRATELLVEWAKVGAPGKKP